MSSDSQLTAKKVADSTENRRAKKVILFVIGNQ